MAGKVGGGPKGKFDLGQNSDMNVTPFVDVMLVLLIIFMVAAPLATVSIKIDLPPPVPPKNPQKEPVFINIEQYGKVFIGPTPTSLETLTADVTRALASPNPTEERIMIRANRYVPYREFMAVLNELQGDGFFKIGLISEDL